MEAKGKAELAFAIQRFIEDKRGGKNKESGDGFVADEEDRLLLSRLLSQLESLKEDNTSKPFGPQIETKNQPSAVAKGDAIGNTEDGSGCQSTGMGTEEIVKELRKVRKQNSITHWLLSILIVVTAVWQLSEVSIVLTAKNKLSHPFRFIGSMISRALKGGDGGANVLIGSDMNESDAAPIASSD